MAPRSFRYFRRLPPELRNMVWKQAIDSYPRVIRVKHGQNYVLLECGTTPPILQVCFESRQLALKIYSTVPSKVLLGPGQNSIGSAQCYINFHVDTIYFSECIMGSSLTRSLRALQEISWYGRINHKDQLLVIKHVAFRQSAISQLFTRGYLNSETPGMYRLLIHHYAVQSVTITLENSRFNYASQRLEAHKYTLEDAIIVGYGHGDLTRGWLELVEDKILHWMNSPVYLATAEDVTDWTQFWAGVHSPSFKQLAKISWLGLTLKIMTIRKTR